MKAFIAVTLGLVRRPCLQAPLSAAAAIEALRPVVAKW
jgi:hypothetical protein